MTSHAMGDSRHPVGQHGPHPRLEKTVRRHLSHEDRAPIPEHTRQAFAAVTALVADAPRPLVLDGGCGTGQSTMQLAKRHPDAWVIGLDKSAHRLRHRLVNPIAQEGRVIWVRAEQAAFYRLAHAASWTLAAHYLLYPNPWPKPQHLLRRWHGHPVWPLFHKLGGQLELRTNWAVYAEEMAHALRWLGRDATISVVDDPMPLTPFEAKYRASGHRCLRLVSPTPA